MRGANPGDVWEFSHIHYCQENRQNHPTQKPEGLIERMIFKNHNVVKEVFLKRVEEKYGYKIKRMEKKVYQKYLFEVDTP